MSTAFARLSVFVGGCTLEAAEDVCDADLDTLQSLVVKSLVRFTDQRYWMLETIREYAAEVLEESGERDTLLERHAGWYARCGAKLLWPARYDEPGARDALDRDLLDIQQALAYALAARDVRLAGDCLFGLWCRGAFTASATTELLPPTTGSRSTARLYLRSIACPASWPRARFSGPVATCGRPGM